MHKKASITLLLGMVACLTLASCGKGYVGYSPASTHKPNSHTSSRLPSGNGGYVKTGKPYQIAGKWYYPLTTAKGYDETGTASWYGKKFHGKATANGERYDMHAMSAAHKTLPLPTMVRVTNLDNGRSAIVRVNDRGPFVKSRIIDLSYAAARSLGYDQQGTARVRVQVLGDNMATTSAAPMPKPQAQNSDVSKPIAVQQGGIYVQLGAFSARTNADQLRQELVDNFPSVQIRHISHPDLYRVRIGPFEEVSETEAIILSLQQQGYHNTIVVIE